MQLNSCTRTLGRFFGAASLAVLSASAIAVPPLDAGTAVLLQRILQYELVLGVTLDADAAACLDDRFAGEWLLPPEPGADVPAAAAFRMRRAYEACSLSQASNTYGADGLTERLRNVATPVRITMENLLKARKALEARKQIAACVRAGSGITAIDSCLARLFATAPDDQARARWLAVAERFRAGEPLAR